MIGAESSTAALGRKAKGMRKNSRGVNKYRVRTGLMASDDSFCMMGAFEIPMKSGKKAFVISSDGSGEGMGWEHVSVSLPNRCPDWNEMCFIKNLFWEEDEVVIQLHPAKSEYVNNHHFCLHLWRSIEAEQPVPPRILVGLK
jgi:hypothetical protein